MKTLIFLFMAFMPFVPNNTSDKCDAQKKYENANFLPTLSIRDTTGQYVQKIITGKTPGKRDLVLYYMKDSIGSFQFDVTEDTKIVSASGDLLEIVLIKKVNNSNAPAGTYEKKSYFYIKGKEIREITPGEITTDYFRVRKSSDLEYAFYFENRSTCFFKLFLRQKLSFCHD